MSYQSISLLAGVPFQLDSPGTLILIDSPGVAGGVDVQMVRNGTPGAKMPNRKAAFRHVGAFDAVVLTVAVNSTVGLFLSLDDVQLGVSDGSAVKIPDGVVVMNTAGNPVPVLFGGTVTPVLGSVTVTNNNAAAVPVQMQALSVLVNIAPVVVGVAAVALVADATLKRLRIRNSHASAVVGLGAVGVTLANAAIQLQPGDIWTEDDAAGAEWYAISNTAGTNVQLQGVK